MSLGWSGLGLCRPEACTWVVSDIYVGVVCCYLYG